MVIAFNKYQGAGNDFIIIDNRKDSFNQSDSVLINRLCDRRFGIGADGLILISNLPGYDFRMSYFNSDGFEGSMCGNGGRCTADFAMKLGIGKDKVTFKTIDGIHQALRVGDLIKLKMNDVKEPKIIGNNYFINTGSPHYVLFTTGVEKIDVYSEGKKLRWSEDFKPGGTNVNFVEVENNGIFVRTFERGVEDETLSCGTGVTASAIASVLSGHFGSGPVNVRTRGGDLMVDFKVNGKEISDIWLTGPATFVFSGEIGV
ncbi:MAG: diaminopimelate epimerase [Bacteroidota bacterium]|nr:diaminopimelate epimerase [Bacteroidota bacterium]